MIKVKSKKHVMVLGLAIFNLISTTQLVHAADPILSAEMELNSEQPKVCAAVRGNGERILAHFHALAGYVEHWGPVDTMAGSSSGTITAFIYESIRQNPLVNRCEGRTCTKDEANLRMSLLLKSTAGILEVIRRQPIGQELLYWLNFGKSLSLGNGNSSDDSLKSIPPIVLGIVIKLVLDSKYIISLIDSSYREWIETESPKDIQQKRQEQTLASINFLIDPVFPSDIFFRRAVLNYEEIVRNVGFFGNFYAGYDEAAVFMKDFVDHCAQKALGKTWDALSENSDCQERFVTSYEKWFAALSDNPKQRLDEEIGALYPSIGVSGYIDNEEVLENYRRQNVVFQNGKKPKWDLNESDLKIGYWRSSSLDGRTPAPIDEEDEIGELTSSKWQAYRNLGRMNWRNVITLSASEPGGATLRWFPDQKSLSLGGWVDPVPVKLLKDVGCDKVIYFTREGDRSMYPPEIIKALGFSETMATQWFDQKDPQSAVVQSMKMADAYWCTQWDSFGVNKIAEMLEDAYHSPIVSIDPVFTAKVPLANVLPQGPSGCLLHKE